MELIQSINSERIIWCCADHGTTPGELASAVGILPATMERVLAGEHGLTFPQLSKVASFFGRGALFFLEPGPVDETQVHTAAFRTLANQKPELTTGLKLLIERVERQREIYLSLREDLDGADLPRFEEPEDLPRENPTEAAKVARRWLGLDDSNTFDSYRTALEARGVLVFRSNGYNGKWQIAKESPILGFSIYDRDCPVIVVKKQASESQQSFTLMHELGHLLLHRSSSIDDERDIQSHQGHEKDANTFAGHLLVPVAFLARVDDKYRPRQVSEFDEWLKPLRREWGLSTEVILRRLLDIGRLSQEQYADYRHWRSAQSSPEQNGGTRMYRHREPSHIFGDRFVRAVLDALNSRYITLAKASSYLDGLKINDLHQLERYYAGV
ncbi:ImmA/IrrE family metallo-endopeptidase [Mycoavidus sp. HKI]|uniref:ImmA/IrrE family metallo-endopeptidase n=1 Tax=Mycoavidus sp. HKI TaxID=2840467 RepID=UPI00215843D1|nr:ImmA/IrrE family metallo-endopeptidase [Mycoavidus sp. HKI]UAW64084.1 ImmA/IrrE family metallo-endopeptidase [Mycoavidus sp. HKI]